MTRRDVDPLAPLKPVARLAAVGVVALGGVLAATQPHPADAAVRPVSAQVSPAAVLGAVAVPPGSTALRSMPSGAPDNGRPPFVSGAARQQTGAVWWSTGMASADVYSWFRAHPPAGMVLRMWGSSAQTRFLGFTPAHATAAGADPTVYVQAFPLPGGRTGIQLSADVVYPLVRTAQQTVPAAAELVVTAVFSGTPAGATAAPAAVTINDSARIARITEIVNSLPLTDGGAEYCPADNGVGLHLTFESTTGSPLATADMSAAGCGYTTLTIGSVREPALTGSVPAIRRIQAILGTHWTLGYPNGR